MKITGKILCRSCDTVIACPELSPGYNLFCPVCNSRIRKYAKVRMKSVAVVSVASVMLFITSLFLPFMTVASFGISQSMSLYSIVSVLQYDWTLLLYVFLFFTFVCPLFMHIIIMAVVFADMKVTKLIASVYSVCHRFCMVDVFVLGVLISLVKLLGMTDVYFHSGFYCMLIFAVLMVWCFSNVSAKRIWKLVKNDYSAPWDKMIPGSRGVELNLILCNNCGEILSEECESDNRGRICPRCSRHSDFRIKGSCQKSMALLFAAIMLYVPANLYPIMITSYLGNDLGSNIMDGVITLWNMNSFFVASVIFIASICIPILKIFCIFLMIYWSVRVFNGKMSRLSLLYRLVLFIGRWSMIDVFVVIIMSTVVRMSGLLVISPGIAIICFCAVVLITMLAAEEFDQRLLWDRKFKESDQLFLQNSKRLKLHLSKV